MKIPQLKAFYTKHEFSELTGIKPRALLYMIKKGRIKVMRISGEKTSKYLIPMSGVVETMPDLFDSILIIAMVSEMAKAGVSNRVLEIIKKIERANEDLRTFRERNTHFRPRVESGGAGHDRPVQQEQ